MATGNYFVSEGEKQKFIDWFWEGTNGNELIYDINARSFSARGYNGNFIRRERHSPFIYGIVLDLRYVAVGPLALIKNHPGKIHLMKVGFTHVDTRPGTGNRMEYVMKQIEQKFNNEHHIKGYVKFSLMVNFVDTSNNAEENVRSRLGIPLEKTLAQWLQLPVPTEWIFTSEEVLGKLDAMIKERKKAFEGGRKVTRVLTTEVFKSQNFNHYLLDPTLKFSVSKLIFLFKMQPMMPQFC